MRLRAMHCAKALSLSLSLSLSLCAVTGPPLLAGIPSQRGRGRPRRRGKDVRLSGRDAFTALSLAAAPADFSAAVSPRARPSTGACPSITTPSPVVLAEALMLADLRSVPSRVVSSRVSWRTLAAASVKPRLQRKPSVKDLFRQWAGALASPSRLCPLWGSLREGIQL